MAKRKTNYLNKRDLLIQVKLSKESPTGQIMNAELAKMLTVLTQKYAKSPQFSRYSYREDMEAFALMMLVKTWFKFDENRSDNPFAFYTQCIKNSFVHFLKQEKKQRNIRDEMLINSGLNPSHTFMIEAEEKNRLLAEERNYTESERIPKSEKSTPLYE